MEKKIWTAKPAGKNKCKGTKEKTFEQLLYLGPGLDNKKGIAHQNNPYIIQVGTINKELTFMLPSDEKKFHAPQHCPTPLLPQKHSGPSLRIGA